MIVDTYWGTKRGGKYKQALLQYACDYPGCKNIIPKGNLHLDAKKYKFCMDCVIKTNIQGEP